MGYRNDSNNVHIYMITFAKTNHEILAIKHIMTMAESAVRTGQRMQIYITYSLQTSMRRFIL